MSGWHTPEHISGELAPLPAEAETPADQLAANPAPDDLVQGAFRPLALQFEDDAEVPYTPGAPEDNPWLGIFRPLGPRLDTALAQHAPAGDVVPQVPAGADPELPRTPAETEVPRTPSGSEFEFQCRENPFAGIFGSNPFLGTFIPAATPQQPDAEDMCPACLEPLSADSTVAWPSCLMPHPLHARCAAAYVPMSRGLAHFRHTGDIGRIATAACPLCRAAWGDEQQSAEAAFGFVQTLANIGVELPTSGCTCSVCRDIGAGPADEELDAGPPDESMPMVPDEGVPMRPMPMRPLVPPGVWCPPAHQVSEPRNSWLYVPVLLEATGALPPDDARRWQDHPAAAPWWLQSVAVLRAAAPRRRGDLLLALAGLLPPGPDLEQGAQRLSGNLADEVTLEEAVWSLAGHRGYVPPLAQDILMQMYGGLDFARDLDVRADVFRRPWGPAPPPAEAGGAQETGQLFQAPPPPDASCDVSGPTQRLQCPLCPAFSTMGQVRSLMNHITCTHEGMYLNEEACADLHGLARGACTQAGCGALRAFASSRCTRCNAPARVRPLRAGDVVPLRPGTAPHEENVRETATDIPEAHAALRRAPQLPADFTERVKVLSSNTLMRVPPQFRQKICDITAENVEGANQGIEAYAKLEEASSKLLLGHIPKGSNVAHEVRQRLAHWAQQDFEALLARAEDQARRRAAQPVQSRAVDRSEAARGQARRSARAGAYRKAVQRLTTSVATFSPREELRWAQELLPDRAREPRPRQPPPEALGVPPPRLQSGPQHMTCVPEPTDVEPNAPRGDGGQEPPKPLDGVRFAPESAPGPSGRRPEHLRDLLGCTRRRSVNRLLRALAETERLADRGLLPRCWNWLLGSRLVFLHKRSGSKPRPVRVGEVLRRMIAKRSLHQQLPKIRQAMLDAHQYGVAIPGGAEILVHARDVIEETVRNDPAQGVWAAVDVDLVNCFPRLEWDEIDEAVAETLPEMAAWTAWCHEGPADIHLPSGRLHHAGRGAEQGDPHGSLQAGLVLARRVRRATAIVNSTRWGREGYFSFWFADDGQVFCRPIQLDGFLGALDDELAAAGATRGVMPDCKSVVRLVGHPDALRAFEGSAEADHWLTDRVRATCRIQEPNSDVLVLGAALGSPAAREAQFIEKVGALTELHGALATLGDAPVEMVLGRKCADVSRVSYLMRLGGSSLSEHVVSQHDAEQQRFLGDVLGGGIHDLAFTQAAAGVRDGGLGFRSAAQMRLLAYLASRIEARPFVARIMRDMAESGVGITGCMDRYDAQIEDALAEFLSGLPPGRAVEVRMCCEEAAAKAEGRLNAFTQGRREEPPGAPVGNRHAGAQLLPEAGTEDHEHPLNSCQTRLQARLARIVDAEALNEVSEALSRAERWEHVRRIRELRDDTVSHDWLWAIGPGEGGCIEPDEYVTAVRLRLGANQSDEPMLCQSCGRVMMHPDASHALCCAPGQSTQGHDEVRDVTLDFTRLADASAEPEVVGLIASAPGLRPADLSTTALAMNCDTALDIGIASPDAAGAGPDCTESMRRRKLTRYGRFLQELLATHVIYRPLIWSCYGREHADTTAVITAIARRAARRQGLADHRRLLTRFRAAVGVALARRSARMVHACLRRPAEQGWQ